MPWNEYFTEVVKKVEAMSDEEFATYLEQGDESLYDSLCTKCKDGDKHGGMFAFGKPFERSSKMLVCLSVRVGRMLYEYCKREKWKVLYLGRFGRSNKD